MVMVMRVAAASSAFSTSSLTTEAGRSTTSPAAIWFTRSDGRTWIRGMAGLYGANQKAETRKANQKAETRNQKEQGYRLLLVSSFWFGFWFLVSGFWFPVSGFWFLLSGLIPAGITVARPLSRAPRSCP